MTKKTVKIFGPPGTGKTTRLLSIMDELINQGVDPSRIAFVSFTKKAADEAAERACEKFNFNRNQLPYFRTLHSLAFRELGIGRSDVMQRQHYQEVCRDLGLSYAGGEPDEETAGQNGDRIVFAEGLARNMLLPLEDWWKKNGDDMDWWILDLFDRGLRRHKKSHSLLDFTDMLELAIKEQIKVDIDVAIIDEAQDLTPLQWRLALQILDKAKMLFVAGDDDQAIYHWAGADVNKFIDLEGEQVILDQSWRLPENIFNLGNRLASRIQNRVSKSWAPVSPGGVVSFDPYPDSVDFSSGSWLLLARNKFMLKWLTKIADRQGIFYSTRAGTSVNSHHLQVIIDWEHLRKGESLPVKRIKPIYQLLVGSVAHGHKMLKGATGYLSLSDLQRDHGLRTDRIWHEVLARIPLVKREYYITLLKKGVKLGGKPEVHIDTIHGVKGGEADNVMLLTDMAGRSFKGLQEDPDNEHRVFYVGATRARKKLHIILPQTENYYEV